MCNIDETYADNPAYHQARDALRHHLHVAGRLIAASLPGNIAPLAVAEALDNNMSGLYQVVADHQAMVAAESPKKDPRHG